SSAKSIRAGSPRRRLSRALAPYPHRARQMNRAVLKHNGRFFRDREIRWQRMLVKCAQSLETAMNACSSENTNWDDRPMRDPDHPETETVDSDRVEDSDRQKLRDDRIARSA